MITASFAKPVGLFDNWFNKVVSRITGGEFCHSEFIVSWDCETAERFFEQVDGHARLKRRYLNYVEDDLIHICFYVLWGHAISYRLLKKNHNNPFFRMPNKIQYACVNIDASEEEEMAMAKFLIDQCTKPYDTVGALTFFIPLRQSAHQYDMYFCSQLMVCAMQQINRMTHVNAASLTPNSLYKLLAES